MSGRSSSGAHTAIPSGSHCNTVNCGQSSVPTVPTGIVKKDPYIDTCQVWVAKPLPSSFFNTYKQRHPGGLYFENKPMSHTSKWQQKLVIQQPGQGGLSDLSAGIGSGAYLINRVDVALDWLMATQNDAQRLEGFIGRHQVQTWHGTRYRNLFEGKTLYWSKTRDARNQFVLYADQPCRHTGASHCVHFERRMKTACAVERAGLNDLRAIMNLNYTDFWGKHLNLLSLDYYRLGKRWLTVHHKLPPGGNSIGHSSLCTFCKCGLDLAKAANARRPTSGIDGLPIGCAQELWDAYARVIGPHCFGRISNAPLVP